MIIQSENFQFCNKLLDNRFLFYLNVIATIFMLLDYGIIVDFIKPFRYERANPGDLAKTSKAGRVTRVIRIIRLIRLIRIVKLYKQSQIARKAVNKKKKFESVQNHDEDSMDIPEESKISKVVSEHSTRAVIIMVLSMLFMV